MKKKISKKDLNKVLIRSLFIQGSWNFERMQALGFCFSMIPIINKLYKNNEKQKRKAIKRHLEFFNSHPYMVTPILGIITAMEEKKYNGSKIKSKTINNIKIGLMGPLAGIGDPLFWGTIRPMLSAIWSSLAISGNFIGPALFFLSFNIIRLSLMHYMLYYGYNKGLNVIKEINNNVLNKITEGSSVLGLFIMGTLVNRWTKINIPIVIYNKENTPVTLQKILDSILPGIVPLLMTLICVYLLKKKKSPLIIMTYILLICIAGNYFGIITK